MNLCGFDIGLDQPFFLIAGPCVVESEQLQVDTAATLKEITGELGINFIFKSSFDRPTALRSTVSAAPGWKKACACWPR
jgi:2-dehydro-3-deoxyphosphooctonate aldolase (KDO 8-P synthase)